MPNIGKRSQGCIPCRRMKVKCSETRPTCERCERVGRTCEWRDSPSIFRSMNETSEQRALNPKPRRRYPSKQGRGDSNSDSEDNVYHGTRESSAVGRRSRDRLTPDDRSSTSLSRHNSYASTQSQSPVAPPAPDWPAQALAYFLAEFTMPQDKIIGMAGYFEFLPELINEAPLGSFLHEAVRAVSLVALGNRSGMDRLGVEGRKSYGRSLTKVRESLVRGEHGDSLLGGVLLLGQYELISGDKPAEVETDSAALWHSHSSGQKAIINLRGPSQFSYPRGRALFRLSYVSLQLKDIAQCQGPKFATADHPADAFLHPHGKKGSEIATKVAVFSHKARSLLGDKLPNGQRTAELLSLIQNPWGFRRIGPEDEPFWQQKSLEWWTAVRSVADEGWAVLSESEMWEAWAPSQWRYQEAPGPSDLDSQAKQWEQTPLIFENGEALDLSPEMERLENSIDPSLLEEIEQLGRDRSPEATTLPRKVYVYQSLAHAFNWMTLWISTTQLIVALLALHRTMSSPSSPYRSLSAYPTQTGRFHSGSNPFSPSELPSPETLLRNRLRDYADKLMASFPYLLSEVDSDGRLIPTGKGNCVGAFYATWPLHMLAGLEVLEDEEREWLIQRLESLAQSTGIRQAGILASWRRKVGAGVQRPMKGAGG